MNKPEQALYQGFDETLLQRVLDELPTGALIVSSSDLLAEHRWWKGMTVIPIDGHYLMPPHRDAR